MKEKFNKTDGQIRVINFKIEHSKRNKQCYILIATDENKNEWVISGDPHNPTYLIPVENSFDKTE